MRLLRTDTWLTVATSSILCVLYGTTFIKVCKGSKYQFVIKLLVLLIVSNISLAIDQFGFYEFVWKNYKQPEKPHIFLISLIFVSGFVYDACFNVSHWIFAFEYYKIAQLMPYVLKGQILPENKLKCNITLNTTMICLNIAFPFLNKIATFKSNLIGDDGSSIPLWMNIFYVVTLFFVLILRLAIGCFLGFAIY